MALVILEAENAIGRKMVRLARQDGERVVPVIDSAAVRPTSEKPHMVTDTDAARGVARIVSEGDTVVLVLGASAQAQNVDLTDRLHATLAGILGRDIRLVVMDGYLPDISAYQRRSGAQARFGQPALRQFQWAADLADFAKQNGSAVVLLRTGPVYGGASTDMPLGERFWRRVMQGKLILTEWSVDLPRDLCPIDDAALALYLLAKAPSGLKGKVEEFHMPRHEPLSLQRLVAMGADLAQTRVLAVQIPHMLRRMLSVFSSRWYTCEDVGILPGQPSAALALALTTQTGFVPTRHEVGIRNTLESLRSPA